MPTTPTYPGVYVEEIPSGVRTLTGVATSITAFIGRAKRGPENAPTTIFSFADYERLFGGLWKDSTMSFAVRDFFLNGGSQAIIVRLYGPAEPVSPPAGGAATSEGAETTTSEAEDSESTAVEDGEETATGEDETLPDGGAATQAAEEPATGPPVQPGPASPASPAASVNGKAQILVQDRSSTRLDLFRLEAADPGSWGNDLRVDLSKVATAIAKEVAAAQSSASGLSITADDLFSITITDAASGRIEEYRNVTMKDGPRNLAAVLAAGSKLARVSGTLADAPSPSTWALSGSGQGEQPAFASVDAAGSDGVLLETRDYTDGRSKKQGIYALEKADLFNLLCIPPRSLDATGDIPSSVWTDAAAYCLERRAFLVADPPHSEKWSNVEAAIAGLSDFGIDGDAAKNAAIFFPRIVQSNPLRDGQKQEFAPCGAIAGVIARTDSARGLWKAPAGIDAGLSGVPELKIPLTDQQNGQLNPLGINCLRAFPAAGRVVWGARTRKGDDRLASEWKYLPVRRTALYIEESLYRGTQWVIFEPNDEPLWAQIRLNVGAFMNGLFRRGAFQGSSPAKAYFVKCDSEVTTQDDIDRGIVNIHVGFAPLKPAEFVIIKLQQLAGQTAA